MQVIFLEKFLKDLDKIKDRTTRGRIEKVIVRMEAAGSLEEATSIRKMTGSTNLYRLRVGDYRIGLIVIEDNVVAFARVAHRKDIYRLFP